MIENDINVTAPYHFWEFYFSSILYYTKVIQLVVKHSTSKNLIAPSHRDY